MDIKLKNTKNKNTVDKDNIMNEIDDGKIEKEKFKKKYKISIIHVLIIILFTTVILEGLEIKENFKLIIPNKRYTETQLANNIDEYTELVETYVLYYKGLAYLKDKGNITQSDIEICRQELSEKIDKEFDEFRISKYNENSFINLSYEEQQKILDEEKIKITEKYTLSDEEMTEYILNRKNNSANELKNKIDSYVNLNYIAYDKMNNIWIGGNKEDIDSKRLTSRYFKKINIDYFGNVIQKMYINGKRLDEENLFNKLFGREHSGRYYINDGYYRNGDLSNNNIELYIWIPEKIKLGDIVYEDIIKIDEAVNRFFITVTIFSISIVLLILCIVYSVRYNNKSEEVDKIINKVKNYPIEYKIGVAIIAWIIWNSNLYSYYNSNYYVNRLNIRSIIWGTVAISIYYLLIKVFIVNYKEGTLLKNNITSKVYRELTLMSSRGSVINSILIIGGLYIALGLMLLCMAMIMPGYFLLFFICGIFMTIALFIIGIKKLRYLDNIMAGAKDAAEGKLNYPIKETGKGHLSQLANNINNIKDGLKKSVENEVKSESMKTELITNVSHDLKTPLTSIINYIDLLKREDIKPETAKDYINILDKKSQRLKVLIEDLFEASKAASGSMELNITKLDIGQLLNQAIGENDERFKENNLEVKLSMPEDKIFINGDGKRLYRVFENLISNAVKYSLNNTRVYIDMKKDNNSDVVITMKNISAYELNFDSNEITNRFKRGDSSRSTEGSGLGLAIAKSIVVLHGGKFDIEVDGDLFKAVIVLKS